MLSLISSAYASVRLPDRRAFSAAGTVSPISDAPSSPRLVKRQLRPPERAQSCPPGATPSAPPGQKPKERILFGPVAAPPTWAISSRKGGEIILERRAKSNRDAGRDHRHSRATPPKSAITASANAGERARGTVAAAKEPTPAPTSGVTDFPPNNPVERAGYSARIRPSDMTITWSAAAAKSRSWVTTTTARP
jgi:hypothetical protein